MNWDATELVWHNQSNLWITLYTFQKKLQKIHFWMCFTFKMFLIFDLLYLEMWSISWVPNKLEFFSSIGSFLSISWILLFLKFWLCIWGQNWSKIILQNTAYWFSYVLWKNHFFHQLKFSLSQSYNIRLKQTKLISKEKSNGNFGIMININEFRKKIIFNAHCTIYTIFWTTKWKRLINLKYSNLSNSFKI